MTDTPKDSPKGEPVTGSRNTPPAKGKPGRENPTVTPRAFSGINPAAKPAPDAAPQAAPVPPPTPPASSAPASSTPASSTPAAAAPGAPSAAAPHVPPPAADAPPAPPAPSAASPAAAPAGGAGSSPPAGGAGSSLSAGRAGASPSAAPGGSTPIAPAPSAPPATPPQKPAPRAEATTQETVIPPVPTPPRPATPQDSSPPRMTNPSAPPAPAAPARGRLEHLALPIAAVSGVAALLAIGISLANRSGPSVEPARVEALEQRVSALQPVQEQLRALQPLPQRLQALESGPLAQAGQRLGAVESGLSETRQAVGALREQVQGQRSDREAVERAANARIEEAERAFSQRISGAEAQIAQRVAAAEAALGPRFAAVEETMRQRIAASEAAAQERSAAREKALDERFSALEARESRLANAERRLARLIASAGVETALEAGRPLGQALSGLGGEAPAALRRYAESAPPTEASLRLSFEDAARAARAKAEPATEGQSVWESAASRLGNLVTVRRGESVVWGDSVSGELEAARRALEAGDLPAAIRRIEGLPEPVRAPMKDWLEQARGLVAARGALGELRSGGQG